MEEEEIWQDCSFGDEWQQLTDAVLMHVFKFLDAANLKKAGQTCKNWHRVSEDEFLWRQLYITEFSNDDDGSTNEHIAQGESWQTEYKRLVDGAPVVLKGILEGHTNEVYHVSFSPSGKYIGSAGKDASIRVWEFRYDQSHLFAERGNLSPEIAYTRFSEFNESENLIMVAGAGGIFNTSNTIVICLLEPDLPITHIISHSSSNFRGAWIDDTSFASGFRDGYFTLFKNKVILKRKMLPARKLLEVCEENSREMMTLMPVNYTYDFIRIVTLPCVKETCDSNKADSDDVVQEKTCMIGYTDKLILGQEELTEDPQLDKCESLPLSSITDDVDSKVCDMNMSENAQESLEFWDNSVHSTDNHETWNSAADDDIDDDKETMQASTSTSTSSSKSAANAVDDSSPQCAKYVLFMNNNSGSHLTRSQCICGYKIPPEESWPADNGIEAEFKIIPPGEGGCIVGLNLSTDKRFLVYNFRPAVGEYGYDKNMQTIVYNLHTRQHTNQVFMANNSIENENHISYIFPAMNHYYVTSGSENLKGFLWDRQSRKLLAEYLHDNSPGQGGVNACAFHPSDREICLTAADDFKVRIWCSRKIQRDTIKQKQEVMPEAEIPCSEESSDDGVNDNFLSGKTSVSKPSKIPKIRKRRCRCCNRQNND